MNQHSEGQFTYSSSALNILMLPLGFVLALVLFIGLSDLINSRGDLLVQSKVTPEVEFLLVRQEMELELRSRPALPEELSEPEMFTTEPMTNESALIEEPSVFVDITQAQFEMPTINVGLAVDMTAGLAHDSELNSATHMFAVDIPFQDKLRATKDIAPRYPVGALRKKVEGRVVVEFLVDLDGSVKTDSIKVIEANPKGVFEKEIIRSLKRSRFESMKKEGNNLVYRARKAYNFKIPK